MKLKLSAAIIVAVLALTQAFAQSPAAVTSSAPSPVPQAGSPVPQGRPFPGRRGMSSQARSQNTSAGQLAALHQRIEDMQTTLDSMHALMKQMRAKSAKSGTKDPMVKANLDMWNLMVGQLDKQLDELKVAAAAREDMEARRVALYKQADAKAEAEAQAFRAGQAAKFAGGAQTPVSAGPPAPAQAPAAQTPATAAAPASPATSAPSPN
jgi:hypothetical protein